MPENASTSLNSEQLDTIKAALGETRKAYTQYIETAKAQDRELLDAKLNNIATERKARINQAQDMVTANLDAYEKIGEAQKELISDIQGAMGSNLGDALGDFATQSKSAKEAFSDFADGVVNDITRIIAQKIALAAVEGLFSISAYAEGGVMPGRFMPITPMQHGGVYNRPTLGLVAEAGSPEAVVPLKGGGVPVEFKDKPKSSSPTYIVNAFSEEFMQQQVNKALSQNGEVILNMVQQDIMAGGNTYQLIRGMR